MNRVGNKAVSYGLVLQAKPMPDFLHPSEEDRIRLGFTVTKQVGNSVVRNRVKRRLRAAAREIMPLYSKACYDYVIIGRKGTLTRPFSELLGDIKYTLRRIHP